MALFCWHKWEYGEEVPMKFMDTTMGPTTLESCGFLIRCRMKVTCLKCGKESTSLHSKDGPATKLMRKVAEENASGKE